MRTALTFFAFLPVFAVTVLEAQHIVAFGDSTTAPRGELNVYANRLAEAFPEAKVTNAGVGGNHTNAALLRFHRDVLSKNPDIVIIQFGINDAAVDVWKSPPESEPRVPLFIYEANLRHFVRTLRNLGANAILMTPNSLRWTPKLKELYGKPPYDPEAEDGFNALLRDYAEVARQVAEEEGVPLVDVFVAFEKAGAGQLLLDGMHPNDAGHELVAGLLKPAVAHAIMNPAPDPKPKPEREGSVNKVGIWLDNRVETLDYLNIHGPFLNKPDGSMVTIHHGNGLITRDLGKTWTYHRIPPKDEDMIIRGERAFIQTQSGVLVLVFLDDAHKDTVKWGWDDEKNAPLPGTRRDVYFTRSLDGGLTWEPSKRLMQGYCGAIRDMVQMRGGRIVIPLQDLLMEEARHATVVVTSDDDGATWQRQQLLDIGGRGHHDGSIEATLVELRDGRLWMLLRSAVGCFLETFSEDGANWTPMRQSRIEASSAPGMLHRLSSGRLILAWNRVYPEGQTNYARADRLNSQRPASWHREELSVAFSEDDGQTWTEPEVIARREKSWLSYPYIYEPEPGVIWVTTMQGGVRASFREADFVGGE